MYFPIPADNRVKLNESENKEKYRCRARELKKLCIMKMTVILIVINAFGTITNRLIMGLADLETRGRVETIQMTAL